MTPVARAVFAMLVLATFGAFFVAQRLKSEPTVLQDVEGRRVFSPNGDGRRDRLDVTFQIKSDDVVSVDVLDEDDDIVTSLVEDRPLRAQTDLRVRWDGRDAADERAPDGAYRLQVTLRDEGRTLEIRRRFVLDATPPVPEVTDVGPIRADGPELLPNRQGRVRIETSEPGRRGSVAIFRTSGSEPQIVGRVPLSEEGVAFWDGRQDGLPAAAGTYVAVAQWRDWAGNLGSSVPMDGDVPALRYGETLPGRGGITIRYLELQPPVVPVPVGERITVGVDARGKPYDWSFRRLGVADPVREGRTSKTPFTLPAPEGAEGVYLFEARRAGRIASVPVAVTNPSKNRVLVVLPMMTWQGRNPVDSDGDGAPNLLDAGLDVRLGRVFAGGRLPEGFREAEGPLLSYLAREGEVVYDVTTDVALATGQGPGLEGHRGVLLPGDVRWMPRDLQLELRRFVDDGGTLALTGLDSLRREVALSPEGVLSRPTAAAATNLFGSRLRDVVIQPTSVTNLEDKIQLFSGDVYGGTGVFSGFRGREETAALGPDEELAANAVDNEGATVVVASRFGDGLVIRTGLIDFATRLSADANSGQLALRMWTLLRTGQPS